MLGCWDRHQKPFRWMGEGVAANIVCRYAFWHVTVLHFACFFFWSIIIWTAHSRRTFWGVSTSVPDFLIVSHVFPRRCSRMLEGERRALEANREAVLVPWPPGTRRSIHPLYAEDPLCEENNFCTLKCKRNCCCSLPAMCAFFAEGPTWSPFTFEVSHRVTIPVYDTCTIYLILDEMSAKAIAANIFLIFIFALISPPESSPFFNSVIAGFVAGTSWTIRTFYRNVEQKVPCPLPKTAGLWWVTVVYCENVRKSNDLVCLCSNILMIIQTITTRCFKCSGATIL